MNYALITKELALLCKEVSKFIALEAQNFDNSKIEHKGLNDLVSYVDKTAEQKLVKGLKQILPEAGFITEENTANTKGELYNWIVDPLDGTTNFIHGLPVYAISVALMENQELVGAVVYEVNREECFSASKNNGAYLNEVQIFVSSTPKLADSLLATGFPYYDFDNMSKYLKILEDLMRNTHGLRRMGSAAVDLAYVACGRFEGFFEYNLNAWDVAAGALIVQEAGGQVSEFNRGADFVFGRSIVASGSIHHALIESIQRHWSS